MTTLSTHVLDAAHGVPAAGITVTLYQDSTALGTGVTDADGRFRFDVDLGSGLHSIGFATGPWFAAAGRTTFYPEVVVAFDVDPGQEHYHVPLLLSPYSYTTYRGS